jgi:protein-tyrosine-phosphatase
VHVTFVCEANQARSPVAAALFAAALAVRQRDDRVAWQVDSAGVFASTGIPAMREMRELAAERGLDLTGHRSRGAEPFVIDVADLVLTMSHEQKDIIGARTNNVVTRCFVLDELVALLEAVANVAVPSGDPSGEMRIAGLPPTPRERLTAAHARRPYRPPHADDDVPDPFEGSGVDPTFVFARLESSVARLAVLLLDG